jgi:hypothetical protein
VLLSPKNKISMWRTYRRLVLPKSSVAEPGYRWEIPSLMKGFFFQDAPRFSALSENHRRNRFLLENFLPSRWDTGSNKRYIEYWSYINLL